jgi:hypothetical protein
MVRPANGANSIISPSTACDRRCLLHRGVALKSKLPALRGRAARLQLHLLPRFSCRDSSALPSGELNDPNAPRSRWALQAAADATLRLHWGPCDPLGPLGANNAPGLCHGPVAYRV